MNRDAIEGVDGGEPTRSRLARAIGPSCLLGLVVAAVVIVLVSRFVTLSPAGLLALALTTWCAVLALLVRWRLRRPPTPVERSFDPPMSS